MPAYRQVLKDAFNDSTKTQTLCNMFVYAVAKRLGIYLPPGQDADGLIDHMSKCWYTIPTLQEAEDLSDHQFVVAGLKKKDYVHAHSNGHVAVLIPRTTQPEYKRQGISWPYAWSATDDPQWQSQGDLSIGGQIWRAEDAPHVRFFTPTHIKRIRTAPSY